MGDSTCPDPAADLLADAQFAVSDAVPGLLTTHARRLGAIDAAIFLVDYEQRVLTPLPRPDGPHRQAVTVEGTLAGRAFSTLSPQWNGDGSLVWVPMVEGNERLGVVGYELSGPIVPGFLDTAIKLTAQVAELVVTKANYGDFFEYHRRFDAMGHGLEAGLLATVAVAAYRNSRRQCLKLGETAAAVDEAIQVRFGPERFVTGVLAELDLASGRFCWVRAGHPAPLLLRGSKVVKTLLGDGGLPLGLGSPGDETEESLEPGDQVVFFTDGVTEARSPDGTFFGTDRLADLVSRASAGGQPPPETLRRLMHSILDHEAGDLHDDATAVLVEWAGQGKESLEP